jgi:hypothetical protein
MKTGDSVRTEPNHCLNCGKLCDGATAVGEAGIVRPEPDSITICLYCGHLMVFDDEMRFRELTDAEYHEVADDPRIVAINKARVAMKAKH